MALQLYTSSNVLSSMSHQTAKEATRNLDPLDQSWACPQTVVSSGTQEHQYPPPWAGIPQCAAAGWAFQVPFHGPILPQLACVLQGRVQASLILMFPLITLSYSFDATKQDRLLQVVHFHGKEAVSSSLPGTTKFGITAAKGFPFAMQNSSCIHRDGRQLIPIKPAVQSLSRSMMELGWKMVICHILRQ